MVKKVTAVIPVCNNKSTILQVQESIYKQTYPIEEYWVMDDASNDSTLDLVDKEKVKIYHHSINKGRGYMRAKSIELAKHPFVLSCDATVAIDPYFLEKAICYFSEENVGAVFGRLEDTETSTTLADKWRKRHLLGQEFDAPYCQNASLQTAGVVFNKKAILSIGNFDTTLKQCEDKDLGERLLKNKWKVIYAPELKVRPLTKNTIRQVLDRYWRWNSPSNQPLSLYAYLKKITYAIKVMAKKDWEHKDYDCLLISLYLPHYQFFKSWYFFLKNKLSFYKKN